MGRHALEIVRRLACVAVFDGRAACYIHNLLENKHSLHTKCEWPCRMCATSFKKSAVSLYSVRRQVPPNLALSHEISRQVIELVEVDPLRIRELAISLSPPFFF